VNGKKKKSNNQKPSMYITNVSNLQWHTGLPGLIHLQSNWGGSWGTNGGISPDYLQKLFFQS